VTTRDRIVVIVLLAASAIAGFWFLALAPKRAEGKKLDAQVATAHQRLQKAQASLGQAEKAKREYDADYATVARLGKAVPSDDQVPSLIYELQTAAGASHIDFRTLRMTGASQPTPTTSAAAASAANNSSSSSASAGSGSSSTPSGGTAAPATATAAASLPPGASVGTAGFPTMPFQFTFQGSFFDMEHLLNEVQRFIAVNGQDVRVRGRLLSIDGFALQPQAFPQVKASITATAYLLPSDEGAAAGATAQGPTAQAPGAQPASTSAPKTTPPASTITGVAR
jgi:hypothetical protein